MINAKTLPIIEQYWITWIFRTKFNSPSANEEKMFAEAINMEIPKIKDSSYSKTFILYMVIIDADPIAIKNRLTTLMNEKY